MKQNIILKNLFYVCIGLLAMMTILMWGFASEFVKINIILTIITIIGVGFILFWERQFVREIYKSSYFKNAFNDGVNVFLILSIIGVINYLVFMHNVSVDVTKTKVHTLSEQSRMVVSQFKDTIQMTLFAKRVSWDTYFELLNQYKIINPNIKIKAVDVDENPALARVQGVTETGSVVIAYADKKVVSKASSELEITNSLLKLQSSKILKVGYTFGHGEIDLYQQDKNGGSFLKAKLLERNFKLLKIDLLGSEHISPEVDLILVLGADKGFLDLEVEKIQKYLQKGGNLFLSFGPNFDKVNWNNILQLMKDNGAILTNTIVLDRLSKVQGSEATIPIITNFNSGLSITKNISGKLLFPLSSGIESNKKEGINYQWLARSSTFPASWAESDMIGVVKGTANFGKDDIQGPVDVAAILTNTNTKNKLVIWGSSASLVNAYQSNALNFNLFFNAIAWVMDDEGLIAISRPGIKGDRIFLASSQITLIFWGAIVVIPFLLSFLGVFFYRRRLIK